jgi:nucleotide-binding universal stress UspA family protein
MLSPMAETIVVGFDGGEVSGRALDRAIEEVKSAGGSVVVVVVEAMPVDPGAPSMYGLDLTAVREPTPLMAPEPSPEIEAVLQEAEKRVDAAEVEGSFVWGFGDPGRTIVDTARDNSATKIVIGADHHGFLGRLFGGDVEAEVRREAACEVVVVE